MNKTKTSNTSFDEVLKTVISRKSKNYYKKDSFWQSDLPVMWCRDFMSHPIGNELLLTYFSNPKFSNLSFLKKVSEVDVSKLIRAIKLTKAYENDKHWESFSWFKIQRNTDLKRFYKELEFIKKINVEWEKDSEFYKGVISEYSYEDILIHTISYFEKFKKTSQDSINNHSHVTMIEVNLGFVLNTMLNYKKQLLTNKEVKVKDIQDFKDEIKKNISNPSTEKITDEHRLLRETIEFFFSRLSVEHAIDLYLCGYADFDYIESFGAELLTNNYYTRHWRNDKKPYYEELYLVNRCEDKNWPKNFEQRIDKEIAVSIQYWDNLKLSFNIKVKNDIEIDVKKVLILLKSFSNYIKPSSKLVLAKFKDTPQKVDFSDAALIQFDKPSRFLDLFDSDYIFSMEENEFIDKCSKFFKWNGDEVREIIGFLTTDLSLKKDSQIDFLTRPFIKIGNYYVWLSSLLVRKWEILLHKRIINEGLNHHATQNTSEIEKSLAEDFKKAGFQAKSGHFYKLENNISGDLDIIAFRGNTLFIIELKTTYIDGNLNRFTKYHAQKFEYKATEQLDKATFYVENNFNLFKEKSGFKIDCTFEELKIIPLIVSNIFESDDIPAQNYLKVSLLELQIILRNDLHNMLVVGGIPVNLTFQLMNQNNSEFRQHNPEVNKEDCNLWTSQNECTAEDLINAIKYDKIWQHLDDLRKPRIDTLLTINKYDKNRKKFLA